MKHSKQTLATLLALTLLVCALPLSAFAAEGKPYMAPIPSAYCRPDQTIKKITSNITLDGVLEDVWKKDATQIAFTQNALKKSGLLWSATTDGETFAPFTNDGEGTAYIGWNEEYFLFALEIKDAKNINNYISNKDLWQGDCLFLQIGADAKQFPPADEDATMTGVQRYEFGFALSSATQCGLGYRWQPASIDLPAAKKQSVKEISGDMGYFVASANGTTTYEVALKPSAFGKNGKLSKGDVIPFSFALHLFKENSLQGGTVGENGDTGWFMEWARGTVGGDEMNLGEMDPFRGVKNLGSAARLTLSGGKTDINEATTDKSTGLLGDVNGDGKVDSGDALQLLRYAAEIITKDDLDMTVADLNGDGKVDSGDALLSLQYAAELITSFDSPQKPNKNKQYQAEIEEENKRHQKAIDEAENYCNMMVSSNEQLIQSYRHNYPVREYYGNRTQYNREANALDEKIDKVQKRIALLSRDTSGIYIKEIEKLEVELKGLLEEKSDLVLSWMLKEDIDKAEEEIQNFKLNKNYQIAQENKLHEENIEKIKSKYGM